MINNKAHALLSVGVLAVIFFTQPTWSQDTTGTITGRVTDSTGAVIPGVAVRILNVSTGVTAASESNQQGNFTVPYLIPGTYTVHAEKEGFRRFVRERIEVRVADRIEVNVAMEVGGLTETVTVTSETPLLETANAALGQVVDSRRVRDLPLSHGNSFHLVQLATGVIFGGNAVNRDSPYEPAANTAYSMAGSLANRAEITMDGASNTTARSRAVTVAVIPPADAVAEFKIETASFDASTSQSGGGQINISTKSGTNDLHGTLYGSKMTPAMTANGYFQKRQNQPRSSFVHTRVGGVVGGPVVIPKVYDGRNKSFFFYSFEHTYDKTPRGKVLTVPTASQLGGDFSSLLKLGANYQIYNPFTRRAIGGGRYQQDPFPGNIIPSHMINPIATNMLKMLPPPNAAGTIDGGNNLQLTGETQTVNYNIHTFRFDQNIGGRQRLMLRASKMTADYNMMDFFNNRLINDWTQKFAYDAAPFVFEYVNTLSSSLLLNVRVSSSRFIRSQTACEEDCHGFDLTTLGFPAYYNNAIDPTYRVIPTFAITGHTTFSGGLLLWRPSETRSLITTVNKMTGSHALKTAFEYRQYPLNQTDYPASTTGGQFNFTGRWTGGPLDNSPLAPRGQGLADALLGLPADTSSLSYTANFAAMSTMYGLFLQDDWRVTNRLNVNLGLRWELEGPLTERYNRSVRHFDASASLPIAAEAQAKYAQSPTPEVAQLPVRGGLTFAGVDGNPRELFNRVWTQFMPRVGFAYSVGQKTVIRGGYGMYYGPLGIRRIEPITTGFSQATNMVPSDDGGVTFKATLSNPYPNGFLQPRGAADGAMTFVGNNITYFNQNPNPSRDHKFQVSIQREFRGRFVVELSYVGNRGQNHELIRNVNALPNEYLSTSPVRDQARIDYLTRNLPNPFYPLLPGTGLAGSVIARNRLLSPYPQFGSINTTVYDGATSYNSGHIRVERRFSRGFTLQAAYAFSKFLESLEYLNAGDAMPSRVVSPYDAPHQVSASGVYELPFGRGRRFLSGNRVADRIVGGWQVQGFYAAQSGQALGFGDAIIYGNLSDIPLPNSERTVERWFNTSVFERSPSRQLASHLRNLSMRFNGIRGDGYNSVNLAALKNTKITETTQFQLRVEFLNAFNQVDFANPDTNPTSSAFGSVTSQKGFARRIQLQAKILF